jgi:hypothetical protein
MPYTDAQGRPEIVASDEFKRGPAAVRVLAAAEPDGGRGEARPDTRREPAGEPAAAFAAMTG